MNNMFLNILWVIIPLLGTCTHEEDILKLSNEAVEDYINLDTHIRIEDLIKVFKVNQYKFPFYDAYTVATSLRHHEDVDFCVTIHKIAMPLIDISNTDILYNTDKTHEHSPAHILYVHYILQNFITLYPSYDMSTFSLCPHLFESITETNIDKVINKNKLTGIFSKKRSPATVTQLVSFMLLRIATASELLQQIFNSVVKFGEFPVSLLSSYVGFVAQTEISQYMTTTKDDAPLSDELLTEDKSLFMRKSITGKLDEYQKSMFRAFGVYWGIQMEYTAPWNISDRIGIDAVHKLISKASRLISASSRKSKDKKSEDKNKLDEEFENNLNDIQEYCKDILEELLWSKIIYEITDTIAGHNSPSSTTSAYARLLRMFITNLLPMTSIPVVVGWRGLKNKVTVDDNRPWEVINCGGGVVLIEFFRETRDRMRVRVFNSGRKSTCDHNKNYNCSEEMHTHTHKQFDTGSRELLTYIQFDGVCVCVCGLKKKINVVCIMWIIGMMYAEVDIDY
eukprot:GHVR01118822.1.p1 GENE.GHVR01118822.1~~GHVR01118822.1.p1  ORF type:complete len:508 (+),score=90.79 GHVR01118822.1:23-1546(+)